MGKKVGSGGEVGDSSGIRTDATFNFINEAGRRVLSCLRFTLSPAQPAFYLTDHTQLTFYSAPKNGQ